jgi:sigma-E factor negative regulatory protein RseC
VLPHISPYEEGREIYLKIYFIKNLKILVSSRADMLKCNTVEEVGVIKSIEGLVAKVSVLRKSACEGCTAGICKPEEQTMEIEALNPVEARVGQKVKIIMKPYTFLRGSIIVYGVPALSLLIGAILGKEVFSHYLKEFDPDIVSAIFGFGAFAISFLSIKLWSNKAGKRVELKPVIEEILE